MRRFVRQLYIMKIYNEADVLVWRTDTINKTEINYDFKSWETAIRYVGQGYVKEQLNKFGKDGFPIYADITEVIKNSDSLGKLKVVLTGQQGTQTEEDTDLNLEVEYVYSDVKFKNYFQKSSSSSPAVDTITFSASSMEIIYK